MADLNPPTPGASDRIHALVKAAVSAAPVVGGPAAELFGVIIPTSLERRRQDWFERVAESLRRVEEQGVLVEELATDEAFITIVVEATKAALGTHIEEKVELLARCVESAALPEKRDEFMAMRLLQYVEELTPEHFVVLSYFADPRGWFEKKGLPKPRISMGSPRHILDAAGLPVVGDILDIVMRDLSDRGLANSGSFGTTMTGEGAWQALATERGRILLDFVQMMDG